MEMEPFHIKFRNVAEKETRCVLIQKEDRDLPQGEYFFLESFCNDKDCDCRRAFINIIHNDEVLATIGYGWESVDYYRKWLGFEDDDLIKPKDVKGPVLELTGHHTKHSEKLLELFKDTMLKDQVFIERLEKHYRMFKDSL